MWSKSNLIICSFNLWLPPEKTSSYSRPNKSFPDFKIVSWFHVKIIFLLNHQSVSSKFQHHQVSEATNPTSKQTLQFSFSNWESQCNSMQQINATAQFIFIHSLHSLHPCHLDVLTPLLHFCQCLDLYIKIVVPNK